MLPYTVPFMAHVATRYPPRWQFQSLGALSQYERLYEVVERLPKEASVLDWGCGNGHFTAYLLYKGFRPQSFSFEPPEFAPPGQHVMGDPDRPAELPFASGSFDWVIGVGVLEHVHETGGSQESSLSEIARVLRPGGQFVAYHFPNRFSWIEALANALKRIGLHSRYTHTRKFDARSIGRLFSDWQVVGVERYAMLPRNSFNRLPGFVSNARWLVGSYDLVDRCINKGLSFFAQNYIVIARKRE